MTLRDYARILRKRWRWVALLTLLLTGGAIGLGLTVTPQYEAETQLFVSAQSDPTNPSGLFSGSQFSQARVKSYADIIANPRITQPVIDQLGLHESAQALAGQITAEAPPDTVLINVKVRDPSARRAQRIANAVSQQFTQLVTELERPPGEAQTPVFVSVVKDASLPKAPVYPQQKTWAAVGLIAGLLLGVAVAFLRESLDTTVKNRDDLESGFGLTALGFIAYDSGAAKHPLLVNGSSQSPRAEAFRQLRTNLQFVSLGDGPNAVVVTSSVAEEGKTTTACNLAITLADAGLRVILVEGDLRRPRIASYLGLEGSVGLTDVLIGRSSVDEVLQPWGGDLLSVLCSGPLPPNPSELLGLAVTRSVLTELEHRADLVIVDAPPLLPVTDAAVLSSMTSGAVLVVRAGHTKRDQVKTALAALRGVDARILGGILNMVPRKGPDGYQVRYGYGYATDPSVRTQLSQEDVRAATASNRLAADRAASITPRHQGHPAPTEPTGHAEDDPSSDPSVVVVPVVVVRDPDEDRPESREQRSERFRPLFRNEPSNIFVDPDR